MELSEREIFIKDLEYLLDLKFRHPYWDTSIIDEHISLLILILNHEN